MKKNGLFVLLALVIIAAVVALLYRSASGDDLPDDDWFEFETDEA
jgi:hypothetical protein